MDTEESPVGLNWERRSERVTRVDGSGREWSREVGNVHRQASAEHFRSVLVSCS
jgi:hypothetical protein